MIQALATGMSKWCGFGTVAAQLHDKHPKHVNNKQQQSIKQSIHCDKAANFIFLILLPVQKQEAL